jgi:hypothetical protein
MPSLSSGFKPSLGLGDAAEELAPLGGAGDASGRSGATTTSRAFAPAMIVARSASGSVPSSPKAIRIRTMKSSEDSPPRISSISWSVICGWYFRNTTSTKNRCPSGVVMKIRCPSSDVGAGGQS